MRGPVAAFVAALVATTHALRYDPAEVDYNLNTNQQATNPVDYWGQWPQPHTYHPSPSNWRFPFYTLFLDRYVNGNPSNDNANLTAFEHDIMQTQLRHGGDIQGLIDSLDYIQGMGVKAIYLAGSPMVNLPWESDGYSPIDFTLLDRHFGTLADWQNVISEIHARNMYVLLDNTMSTMSDLIGFEGYLNASTPFLTSEHSVQWKTDRQYLDFAFGNDYNETCEYPRFYNETGYPVGEDVTSQLVGCFNSEFDQYGDVEAFGVFPDWQRELAKFASVQDRLREWVPSVREKIQRHSCIMIAQLDIDGFRFDKATQVTVDAQGAFGEYIRNCAAQFGKHNFFMPGEITGGNTFGSIYLGRGRLADPAMQPANLTAGVSLTNTSSDSYFIRDLGQNALDAAAFHYTIYRSLTRFLGMDGNLEAGYDASLNWVDGWNDMLTTNDLINANTGVFDPRHMYGVTNQDVFRWPAIVNGTDKMLLGLYITTIHMPGIPLLLWGEEQAFYILDNTADNYIFGRQAMSSSTAWQTHGCYILGSSSFFNWNTTYVESALYGCHDDSVSLDHRDPASPVRNIIKTMYQMRENYPVLNDGFFLQQLSNMTTDIQLPGSNGTPTETGMWSTVRSQFPGVQDLSGEKQGDQSVWLVYQNGNTTVNYQFDCSNNDPNRTSTALVAPFDAGTTVKNLFYPYDEVTLEAGAHKLGINGSTNPNGCLQNLTLKAWEFKAYVPSAKWVGPRPMMTKFVPGHDARVLSTVAPGKQQSLPIELHFSQTMDCTGITNAITFNSTTEDNSTPTIDPTSITCGNATDPDLSPFNGALPSEWTWKATLNGVADGVHRISVMNGPTPGNASNTQATDNLLFRIGQPDNPMIFPMTANYTKALLHQDSNGGLYVTQKAAGADLFRYSLNWGSSFSDWTPYTGGNTTLEPQAWSGTSSQAWTGTHVIMQYWSRMTGSSDHQQEADLDDSVPQRRFPHLFWQGPYNQYGFDAGLHNVLEQDSVTAEWSINFMTEWPAIAQVNIWGMNPDGQPDQTGVLGDIDADSVLDRLPPSSLSAVAVNFTGPPPVPYLAWQFVLNDGTYKYRLEPVGNMYMQMALYFLFWIIPVTTGTFGIWVFMKSFYKVKFNQTGISAERSFIPLALRRRFRNKNAEEGDALNPLMKLKNKSGMMQSKTALAAGLGGHRRMVLIATMEYDIEDWAIKIKIGGLGVMAQLMGKNLGHQDLIWIVPCVGGVDYPEDQRAEPMMVTILGNPYEVQVQYHILRNITYVLLDAPVFRQQTKSEPYPPRMDDLDSAIYYSAWNQCIALAIKRFHPDLYHINDYHGAVAPIHLLPETIPCCLSLHNAEFQGLWPMRTPKERDEVCQVYNLPVEIAAKYVQFGEVFNLLHAGASYLRIHQQGFGAVGVSKKYGKRSYARYPIFWGLKRVGNLPNPDPSDTGEWDKQLPKEEDIKIDPVFEGKRVELKRQAQEWAGLDQNPKAELLVFVGRWSNQKGVDLIADVLPAVLEEHPDVQLICVGPVIDLYGKFAALKLDKMMKIYPGRVFSKPEFTALPPYIFSGAEFALIPSRDEPFGLVAVEFGRKGALGIGARVGGLGQMPGWWYTVESTTTTHLLHQFKMAIESALASKQETRAMMRARSAKQRFPVAQWVEDLEILQSTAIKIHSKEAAKAHHAMVQHTGPGLSGFNSAAGSGFNSPNGMMTPTLPHSRSGSHADLAALGAPPPLGLHGRNSSYGNLNRLSAWTRGRPDSYAGSRAGSPSREREQAALPKSGMTRTLSLGMKSGPGHVTQGRGRNRMRRSVGRSSSHQSDAERDQMGQAVTDVEEESDNDIIDMYGADEEYTMTREQAEAMQRRDRQMEAMPTPPLPQLNEDFLSPRQISMGSDRPTRDLIRPPGPPSEPGSAPGTPGQFPGAFPGAGPDDALLPPMAAFAKSANRLSNSSMLSLDSVVGEKKDFKLQKVDPFFTDSTGEYFKAFEEKLATLDGKNSEGQMCIEDYLVKSEKKWFDRFRNARLGRAPAASRPHSPAPSIFHKGGHSPEGSIFNEPLGDNSSQDSTGKEGGDQFLLGADYHPPTGLKKWMQMRVGDWPLYSLFLAFGQIIAANSYQITLLTGTVGQTAEKLYVVASIYMVTSVFWWLCFRYFKSVYVLSVPFLFYGLAFFFIGTTYFVPSPAGRGWMQNIATAMYAIASSSGSVFFALNFGDEGGAPVKAWVYRACVIQGTQQAYVVGLWYWGSILTKETATGYASNYVPGSTSSVTNSYLMTAITVPIAVVLWLSGLILFFGLPDYYRQAPGAVPSFYSSLGRRKIILWFFVTVLIQNYWLSAPYGRNWGYLWSSNVAQPWQIVLLCVLFFGLVWAAFLWVFGILSKDHSWILPVFAIGLGAPRWCQMLWGTSNIGQYVPWVWTPLASALVGRSLWLWLGVLDALQGVGFGMILLQTLTRIHIAFTLIAAQVLGSIATMLARATAPNAIGPGDVFPDFSGGIGDGLSKAWFWVALVMQLIICVGFFTFFRKEQLSKP
ncbi:Cell wall alpha-1,3-glucan synthase ags1 [Xylographa trunciseda]|nr:Cell wall alpha-1,3-glucan synthase ags1 [Xylographa trunciseda]